MPIVLNVAEKPSVAREVSRILGGHNLRSRPGMGSMQVHEFPFRLRDQDVQMHVTSVVGHLKELDFGPEYKDWQGVDPDMLFEAPVSKHVRGDLAHVERNLQAEARQASELVCWLDCDREGENIGFEVIDVCRRANPGIAVSRAHFSALTPRDIFGAVARLGVPDERASDAVDTRQEVDLRIGAAFTRLQTLLLRPRYVGMPKAVSYGPCQFPTLGFVVARHWERVNFVPEDFWYIRVVDRQENDDGTESDVCFTWGRERLFDHLMATVLYERCLEEPTLTVLGVVRRPKRKFRPFPLATVELQKLAARHLRLSSERTMQIAEGLYNEGLLSYPRTETDKFTFSDEELKKLIQHQAPNPTWGSYATDLLEEKYTRPKAGKNDDQAHPPIHPTAPAPPNLEGDRKNVYELVARHFLACCSEDAIADEVAVSAVCAGEEFSTSGQTIIARNYLDVYKYDRWSSTTIPNYTEGTTFSPKRITLESGRTAPPNLLTEAELITLMDKNGIGTDATIAQHIKTIKDREYAVMEGSYFNPTKLGLALVEAYDEMGFCALSQPRLRSSMESDLAAIAKGTKTRDVVLREHLAVYRAIFREARSKSDLLVVAVGRWYRNSDKQAKVVRHNLLRCKCGDMMALKAVESGSESSRVAGCDTCSTVLMLPPRGDLAASPHTCPLCQYQVLEVRSEGSQGSHFVCPSCFSSPPQEAMPDMEDMRGQMRCFMCSYLPCPLAKNGPTVWKCPACASDLVVKRRKDGNLMVGHKALSGNCPHVVFLPRQVGLRIKKETCPAHSGARLVVLTFRDGVHPGQWRLYCDDDFSVETCLWCEERFDGVDVKGYQPGMGDGGRGAAPPPPPKRSHGQTARRGRGGRGGRGGGFIPASELGARTGP